MLRCPFLLICPLLALAVVADAGQGQPVAQDLYGDPLPAGAVATLGDTNWWHGPRTPELEFAPRWYGRWIQELEFAPGDRMLASYGSDDRVCLWDTQTGKLLRQLPLTAAPDPKVEGGPGGFAGFSEIGPQVIGRWLAFSADGQRLATVDRHALTLKIWH